MKITICHENNDKFQIPREISRTGYLIIYQVIVSVVHSRNFDDLLCEITVLHQGLERGGGGGEGPDPAFPLLFHENPESRTFFTAIPKTFFFFPKKDIKKLFPQELIVRSDVRIGPFG